ANIFAPLRSGSDIVFLGAVIKYLMEKHEPIFEKVRANEPLSPRERFFHDYIVHYTNAATIITEEFKDTEDLAGLFVGYDAEKRRYDNTKWRYDSEQGAKQDAPNEKQPKQSFADTVGKMVGPPAKTDPTLLHERCVWQILKKHFQRYTPQLVED